MRRYRVWGYGFFYTVGKGSEERREDKGGREEGREAGRKDRQT